MRAAIIVGIVSVVVGGRPCWAQQPVTNSQALSQAQALSALAQALLAQTVSSAAATPATKLDSINNCVKMFPLTSPPQQYFFKKMEFGVLHTPPGTNVGFLLQTAVNDGTGKPPSSALWVGTGLWLPRTPMSVSNILDGQYIDFPMPKQVDQKNITIGITPALFVGANKRRFTKQRQSPSPRGKDTNAYCLQEQLKFTWHEFNDPDPDPNERVDEVWFGTTSTSPVYAVFRVRWTTIAAEQTPAPPNAAVYFINLKDGDTVMSPFKVQFGLSGMGIAPAGVERPNTGHHHLLIDTTLSADELKQPIPMDDKHRHFGDGQTETMLTLPPGRHTIELELGDWSHVPFNPPIMSPILTVTVR
jgi:hypothetical protein